MSNLDPKTIYGADPANYARYRPQYPSQFIDETTGVALQGKTQPVIIDMGAGTGRLGSYFVDKGYQVIFVEPNDQLRAYLEQHYCNFDNVTIVDGTAEQSNLASQQADLIVMGDSAHWFDRDKTLAEYSRLLAPEGKLAAFNMIWSQQSPITKRLDELLKDTYHDFASSGKSLLVSETHLKLLQGSHLISADSAVPKGYTFFQPFSKDDFVGYMKTLSWNARIEADEALFRRSVVDPLWEFGTAEGVVNSEGQLKLPIEVRSLFGSRDKTRSEALQFRPAGQRASCL